jgi:hypothetical protein
MCLNPLHNYAYKSVPRLQKLYDKMDFWGRIGRLSLPWAMFAYPFYLWKRSPGKDGSHFDPKCDLFKPEEGPLVQVRKGASFIRFDLVRSLPLF